MLRNKVSRVRPNVEKQHGVVRSDCVTLPAFRVTYALQPRGADRTRVELTLGADPGIPCPPWLIRWGLGHADRTLEALEATVTARAAEKALRRRKGRPAAARDPSVVLLSNGGRAGPWRADPFREAAAAADDPAAFNFRPQSSGVFFWRPCPFYIHNEPRPVSFGVCPGLWRRSSSPPTG